jgi:hypothetical protein
MGGDGGGEEVSVYKNTDHQYADQVRAGNWIGGV